MLPFTPIHYFICGIGGSGMLPLAIILKGMGHYVSGSDRSFDQGRTPEKFVWIKSQGINLFPQDGSGISDQINFVVISKAVEDTVPDIIVAKTKNIPIRLRVDMLVELFNKSKTRIAVAGTSGKTTTTGMAAFILKESGKDPIVMNGGIFKNYMSDNPYSTAFVGRGDVFLTEMDESDGIENVVRYNPDIAVIHNITLDHQPMAELRDMFEGFLAKTTTAILNADDENVLDIARDFHGKVVTYSTNGAYADVMANNFVFHPDGVEATVMSGGESFYLKLSVPGKHNVSNALAALCVAVSVGLSLQDAINIISRFSGIKRRLDIVGQKEGVIVIDDFAHNPDKIAATLETLKEFDGRLKIFFQPHGYGFLKVVGAELGESFAKHMRKEDVLYMVEPFYAGGTVDKTVGAQRVVDDINHRGKRAFLMSGRHEVREEILRNVTQGDRIIVMGARDDTLSDFAKSFLV